MKKTFFLATVLALVISVVPAFASTKVFDIYSGRNGVTVNSESVGTKGTAVSMKGMYKTAVCFGSMSTAADKATVQGSYDGSTWYDCVDDAGSAVSWTKSTVGTVKKWWDNFFKHRATYKKNNLSGKTISVEVVGSKP